MSYLDEISGGSYYLNAFNNLLKRRQMENAAQNQMQAPMQNQMENQMMGGGNQDFNQGRAYASPSGPDALGLGPAQDRSAFRDTMREMPPALGYALGMIPGIGKAFSLARAADYVMGKEAEARNAPANQKMSEARQNFQATEKGGSISNLPQQAFQLSEKNYNPTATAPQSSNFFASLFGPSPIEDRAPTPNPYGGVNPALSSTGSGFAGADVGVGGGFTGGVATGTTGGSPAEASNLGYNQGGMVNAQHLMGRAPAPDDGYGALQGGEYVITKAAVERYGKAMMDAINNGTFR